MNATNKHPLPDEPFQPMKNYMMQSRSIVGMTNDNATDSYLQYYPQDDAKKFTQTYVDTPSTSGMYPLYKRL
jgi:hypothetical protein